MSSNQRRSAVARSLAVRAAQAGRAAAAQAIARRHSRVPMFGMSPIFSAVAGLCTASVPPFSAPTQSPSLKHSSRSSRRSLSCIVTRMTRSAIRSTFENGGDAHPARGADRDQAALGLMLIEYLGERGDDARAGRGKGVAYRETAAFHVELGSIDAAECAGQS